MSDLSQKCLYYRAKKNLTQREMAELCGVDRTTIIKVESGKPVSKLTTIKIEIGIENIKD